MKSLSKGNNSKKDILSSTLNLKESTTIPLSGMTYEDDIADSWPENTDQEEFDDSEEFQEPDKPLWKKNGKVEAYEISNSEDKMRRTNGQTKWKDPPKFETKNSHADDDMNALLKVRMFGELLTIRSNLVTFVVLYLYIIQGSICLTLVACVPCIRKRKILLMLIGN